MTRADWTQLITDITALGYALTEGGMTIQALISRPQNPLELSRRTPNSLTGWPGPWRLTHRLGPDLGSL